MKTPALVVVLSLMLSANAVAALNSDAGTSSFQFLKIAQTARSVGMGTAGVADAADASALQLNPAGLSLQRNRTLSASYSNVFSDVQSGFLSYSHPLEPTIVLGASLTYLTSGDIPKTVVNSLGEVENVGTFGFSALAFTGSAGVRLYGAPDTLSAQLRRRMREHDFAIDAGLGVRGIYERLDGWTATGLGVDLGVIAHMPDGRTRVGASVTNLGKQLTAYNEIKDGLPTVARAGVRHQMQELPLLFAGDVEFPKDNKIRFALGTEAKFGATRATAAPFALRAGYNTQGRDLRTTSDDSFIAGFSFGGGLRWQKYMFDYSFTPGLGLGSLHCFTISGNLN